MLASTNTTKKLTLDRFVNLLRADLPHQGRLRPNGISKARWKAMLRWVEKRIELNEPLFYTEGEW